MRSGREFSKPSGAPPALDLDVYTEATRRALYDTVVAAAEPLRTRNRPLAGAVTDATDAMGIGGGRGGRELARLAGSLGRAWPRAWVQEPPRGVPASPTDLHERMVRPRRR